MKTLLRSIFLPVPVIWITGCGQQAKTTDNAMAFTPEQSAPESDMSTYNPAMDLTIMATDAVEMFGDTLAIKMYISTMVPDDAVGWYFHPDHTIRVLEGGTLDVYFNASEEKITMELPVGVGIHQSGFA